MDFSTFQSLYILSSFKISYVNFTLPIFSLIYTLYVFFEDIMRWPFLIPRMVHIIILIFFAFLLKKLSLLQLTNTLIKITMMKLTAKTVIMGRIIRISIMMIMRVVGIGLKLIWIGMFGHEAVVFFGY